MTAECSVCPRRCFAPREALAGSGICGMGTLPVVTRAAPHFGEEPCISGVRGSGTVFFSGCALGCVFCQNAEISRNRAAGQALSIREMGMVFQSLKARGVHNINLVTASHFAPEVAQALRAYPPGIPVVYNCGGYESLEILAMLDGLVDVYLPDFKYGDGETARLYSHAPDYPQVALTAIREMRRQTGPAFYDDEGMLIRGTMVRHLVLPGLSGASMAALAMLRDVLPEDVPLSLMGQYTPYGGAREIPGLERPVTPKEYRRVKAQMAALGFPGYIQALAASGTEMVPPWDLTGLPKKE